MFDLIETDFPVLPEALIWVPMPPEMRPSKSLIATAIQNKHKESLFSLGCRRPAVSSCRYTVRGYTYAHVNIVGEQDRGSCRKKDRESHALPQTLHDYGELPPDPTEPTLSITMMAGKPDAVGAKSGQHRSPNGPLVSDQFDQSITMLRSKQCITEGLGWPSGLWETWPAAPQSTPPWGSTRHHHKNDATI